MLSETVVSAVWSVCMPERAMFIMALMAIAYLRPARRAGLVGNICRMATGLAAPLRHNPLIRNNFIFEADSLALAGAQERRQNRRACRHSPPWARHSDDLAYPASAILAAHGWRVAAKRHHKPRDFI